MQLRVNSVLMSVVGDKVEVGRMLLTGAGFLTKGQDGHSMLMTTSRKTRHPFINKGCAPSNCNVLINKLT